MVLRYKAFPVLQFLAVILIFVFLLSGCNTANPQVESESESKIKIAPLQGFLAPDFELEDLTGKKIRLSSLRGRIVVLNFWSMGCRYCLMEMPDFDEFNRSKSKDVTVLMVNLDKDTGRLPIYIKNQGFSFTVLKDEMAETARTYMIRGIPTTFIVDKDGIIASRIEGALSKNQLDSLITQVTRKF
ncbi:MAG: TlpA family protein disulfide reductase [Thermoanaerobacteraceae bacterium]|nr:TlpA family protein disulfide reductase [Thermoanaerobacteraceae bacterium]